MIFALTQRFLPFGAQSTTTMPAALGASYLHAQLYLYEGLGQPFRIRMENANGDVLPIPPGGLRFSILPVSSSAEELFGTVVTTEEDGTASWFVLGSNGLPQGVYAWRVTRQGVGANSATLLIGGTLAVLAQP